MTEELSAGIIPFRVTDDGFIEILSVLARTGDWEFPKGSVEGNEELQQTALRELAEETNLEDVRLIDGFSTSYSYSFYWEGEPVDKTVKLYLGEVFDSDELRLSSEHRDYEWVELKNAIEKLSHSGMRRSLDEALTHLRAEGYYPYDD